MGPADISHRFGRYSPKYTNQIASLNERRLSASLSLALSLRSYSFTQASGLIFLKIGGAKLVVNVGKPERSSFTIELP